MSQEPSENFGNLPNSAETFGNLRNVSERKENHILTVREVARMFENAGVARTERSIINWCHPDKHGACRLDNFYDANERKYFITPQSVERAIEEELAKAKNVEGVPNLSEPFGNLPYDRGKGAKQKDGPGETMGENEEKHLKELEKELIDLKITNKAKDYFIDQLKEDRENFVRERASLITQFAESARRIGELETRLLQLEGPKQEASIEKQPAPEPEAGEELHQQRAQAWVVSDQP